MVLNFGLGLREELRMAHVSSIGFPDSAAFPFFTRPEKKEKGNSPSPLISCVVPYPLLGTAAAEQQGAQPEEAHGGRRRFGDRFIAGRESDHR